MSTIQRVNFELVSDMLSGLQRKDFPLADRTLSDPSNAVALVDGEWMTINSSYQCLRAADVTNVGDDATLRSFPYWMEKGRYDVQAVGKGTLLWLGAFEADTRVYDATAAGGAGAAIATVLQGLKVQTITVGTRNYVGLVGHGGAADTAPVVGYVTRLPASNGGKLRFRCTLL